MFVKLIGSNTIIVCFKFAVNMVTFLALLLIVCCSVVLCKKMLSFELKRNVGYIMFLIIMCKTLTINYQMIHNT